MSIYSRMYDFMAGAVVRSQEFDDEFNAIQAGFSAVETRLTAAVQTPENTSQTLPSTVNRINKILSFDASGNVVCTNSFTGSFSFSGTLSCADPVANSNVATKQWVTTLALAATIPVSPGDAGKAMTNNGSVVQWGVGIPSLAGKAGQFLRAEAGETQLEFVAAAEVPLGAAVLLPAENTANTVTVAGATYLKTGVLSDSATYPLAPIKSYFLSGSSVSAPVSLNGPRGVFSHGVLIFPAVAGGTSIYTTDGTSWLTRTLPASVTPGQLVSSGSRVFFANQYADTGAYSDDTITWTAVTLPSSASNWWTAQCYGAGKFIIARGGSVNTIQSSADGITWTPATLPVAGTWAIRFVNSLFVAVKVGVGTTYYTSPDLITWTSRTLPENINWTLYQEPVNGRLIAQGNNYHVYWTSDGIGWTQFNPGIGATAYTIGYISGRYVCIAQIAGRPTLSSTDMATWREDWYAPSYMYCIAAIGGSLYGTNGTGVQQMIPSASGYVGSPTNKTVDVGDGQLDAGSPRTANYYIRVA